MKKQLLRTIGTILPLAILIALPLIGVTEGEPEKGEEPDLPVMDENAPLEVDVWGGIRDLYSIAVPKPLEGGEVAKQVKEVQETDYRLSSLFKVLDSRSFIADLKAEGMGIQKDPWHQVGAQGVSKCTVTTAGDTVKLKFALFEVARGNKVVLTRTYSGSAKDVRSLVHKWVNEVIKHFTGEPGAFGTRIAFGRKTGPRVKHVYTADWTGGGVSRVSKGNTINMLPAFGPGGSIYYTSFKEGSPYLYRAGQKKAVLSYKGLNMGADFSGGRMAVVLSKDGNPEIYVGSADGSGMSRVTSSGAIDVSPSFSPDGSKIAFVSNRHGSPQVFVMGSGGGGATRATYKGSYNQTPSWCPRGGSNLIAFTGRDGGTYDVFTVDVGSKEIRRLTQGQGRNMDPAFSPDCRQVAFHSSRGGIFISNPEGLNQQKVLGGGADTIKWSD